MLHWYSDLIIIIIIRRRRTLGVVESNDLPGFQKVLVTDQTLHSNHSPKNFRTILYLNIYRAGWRLISFKLSCNLFGIIPAVNGTGGTVQAVCSCRILISSSVKSYISGASW